MLKRLVFGYANWLGYGATALLLFTTLVMAATEDTSIPAPAPTAAIESANAEIGSTAAAPRPVILASDVIDRLTPRQQSLMLLALIHYSAAILLAANIIYRIMCFMFDAPRPGPGKQPGPEPQPQPGPEPGPVLAAENVLQ